MTPELQALRRAVERDRYGLMAQVLLARDHCTPTECAAFRSLTDSRQIAANMDEHTYDGLVARYAPSWNVPPPVLSAGRGAGCRAWSVDADGQAHQCRLSDRRLDPGGQHHDAGAAIAPFAAGGSERVDPAATQPRGRRKEAGSVETRACRIHAGADLSRRTRAGGHERLILVAASAMVRA